MTPTRANPPALDEASSRNPALVAARVLEYQRVIQTLKALGILRESSYGIASPFSNPRGEAAARQSHQISNYIPTE